jgi:hypothetical protein
MNKIFVKKNNKWNIEYIDFSDYKVHLKAVNLYFPDKSWIRLYFQRPDFISGYFSKKETQSVKNISSKIAHNPYNNDPELKELTIDYLKNLIKDDK